MQNIQGAANIAQNHFDEGGLQPPEVQQLDEMRGEPRDGDAYEAEGVFGGVAQPADDADRIGAPAVGRRR